MNSDQSSSGQHGGHALGVERVIDVPAGAIFDAFIALYDSQRPDGQRVRLVQQGFPTVQARDDFTGAWPDVLDEVARRAVSRRP